MIVTIGRVLACVGGVTLVLAVGLSALRTVVLPRGEPVFLTRAVFVSIRWLFGLRLRGASTYEQRDRAMAMYAPVGLVSLPGAWVTLVVIGFTGIHLALGAHDIRDAFYLSGSSLFTLGIDSPPTLWTHIATFVEATLGLALIALLISYLPSIYSAFQRRELLVARLVTRAGEPASAIEMIRRHHALNRLEALDDLWDVWESWFADLEETHTSQPSLVFFRSISHERSWVTAAGVVLDTAALRCSTLDVPVNAQAQLCIRAGYLSLRRIADYFSIPYDDDPAPDDPISIHRSEFDAAYDELAGAGIPVRADRDACWRAYAGWRVNYDAPLLALAGLTMAPYSPWSSDRSLQYRRSPLLRRRRS